MMLQTSVWFNRVIDRSKALCTAIYYIPAAHWMHCGKLLIRLINDPFHAMTLHQYFTLFINIPPAFQPSHLLSRIPVLRVSADSAGAFNGRHYSARYCVFVAFCSCDSIPVFMFFDVQRLLPLRIFCSCSFSRNILVNHGTVKLSWEPSCQRTYCNLPL